MHATRFIVCDSLSFSRRLDIEMNSASATTVMMCEPYDKVDLHCSLKSAQTCMVDGELVRRRGDSAVICMSLRILCWVW